jgi:hypothetical protein
MAASPSPIAKKLLLKTGMRGAVVNAPSSSRPALEPLPDGIQIGDSPEAGLDFMLLFARDRVELERFADQAVKSVKPDGLLWVSYLKGGKKAGTDLNRDILWEAMAPYGVTGVTLVALDGAWSAMRFRPAGSVGK